MMKPVALSLRATLACLLFAVSAAGCYGPNIANGQQQCSVDGKCAEGFQCFPDKHCYKLGTTPDCSPACVGGSVCDKTTLKCVECLIDKDCPAGRLCDASKKTCKSGCSATHPGCGSDAGSCDVDMGACRGCLTDGECTDMANPRCDVPSGRCVPCTLQNDNCPTGQYCSGANGSFACANGCKSQRECVPDADMGQGQGMSGDGGVVPAFDCCNHQCVDTSADKVNCGACGKTCENSNTCCSGACSDVTSDVNNCGGCGAACQLQNVMGPLCASSVCGFSKCKPGFGDCDLKPQNGCETNIGVDPKNCGACGMSCGPFANAIPGCMTATCTIASCMKGFSDCDGAVKTGCEVDSFNDVKNCGGCGAVCPNVINGMPDCMLGKCGIGTCNGAFRDCDGVAMNGCEANLLNDARNCGGCNLPCMLPNAAPACANAVCVVGMCNPGFANCDNAAANGCEVNTNVDVNNCGACGNRCPMGVTCTAGKCGVANSGGKLLILTAEGQVTWNMDVQQKMQATGAFTQVDIFQANTATATVAQLQAYDVVLVFADGGFQDPIATGDNLATYWDGGGRVVVATFANCLGIGFTGRFGTPANGYVLISPMGQEQPTDSLGTILEPMSPLVAGVATLSATAAYRSSGGVINGGIVVAQWKSGKPLIVRGVVKGRNRADLNMFPPSGTVRNDLWMGDGAAILKNALIYK